MATDSLPGKFGRYEVEAQIGEGSMGRVYRAFDPLAQRFVCVKTLRPEILTEDTAGEYLVRFEREARAAAGLSHPHIVTIHDVGQNYFVMELLEGVTLQGILAERGKLPPDEVVRILEPVADALDYAHSRGVIHRDVKPGNIIVLSDGRAKIMDFGVAHFGGTVTARGQFYGSPSYMAPERIARSESTPGADLFSLAVVAYEMVTGQRPFQGDTITSIIYRIVNEDPPAPSARNAELAPRYDAVFGRALAKDPAARFPSAKAFLGALADRAVETPPDAAPPTPRSAPASQAVGDVETQDLKPALARWDVRSKLALAAGVVLLAGVYLQLAPGSPPTAAIGVQTLPSAATVLVDGATVGRSPLSLEGLKPGAHTVRVTREGFAPAEVSLHLLPGAAPVPLRFKLQPVAAILSVRSQPQGAKVAVDGEAVGSTPLAGLPVSPGVHSVRVEREGYRLWGQAVEARSGQETTLEADLEASGHAPKTPGRPGGWVAEGDLIELAPGVEPPKKVAGEPAAYPSEAARLKLQGAVTVEMIVTERGEVTNPRVIESAGETLDEAVLDAVRGWRFEPARKNEVRVRVRYTYRQQFTSRP